MLFYAAEERKKAGEVAAKENEAGQTVHTGIEED